MRKRRSRLVGDGITDDAPALNLWLADIAAYGGDYTLPPGTYFCASQPILNPTCRANIHISAYGAEIKTAGAISGFRVAGGMVPHLAVIEGLKINHRGNSTATYGMEQVGAANASFLNCTVEVHGVAASYRGFIARNSDPADNDTGSNWAKFINCTLRKRSGADDVGDIPVGICLRGAANAAIIQGCSLSTGLTGDGILIEPESGHTYVANGAVISSTHFEGATNAIRCTNSAGGILPAGLRVWGNRAEALTTFFKAEGATVESPHPPYVPHDANYCGPDMSNYVVNPTGLTVRTGSRFIPYAFSSSTSCVVSLSPAEPDTNYMVFPSAPVGAAGGGARLSAKTATSLTLVTDTANSHCGYVELRR